QGQDRDEWSYPAARAEGLAERLAGLLAEAGALFGPQATLAGPPPWPLPALAALEDALQRFLRVVEPLRRPSTDAITLPARERARGGAARRRAAIAAAADAATARRAIQARLAIVRAGGGWVTLSPELANQAREILSSSLPTDLDRRREEAARQLRDDQPFL